MSDSILPYESTHTPVSPADQMSRWATAFIATRDVVPASRTTYRRALKAFFDWLNKTGASNRIDRLTRLDVLSYKTQLAEARRAATVSMYLFVVKSFFAWLDEQGAYGDIARGVKSMKCHAGHA